MAILLGDLREAFKKLNQMEEAAQALDKQSNLSDRVSTDKMLGTFGAKIDPTSQILDAARKSASMGMLDTSGMLGLTAGQALADALQKGLFPDIPNAADALLGSLPGFAEIFAETERRRQETLDFYRPQAYERITPADIDHAITRIDWAAFIAAQRPSLTETEEAATHPRQAPVIEERTQLATALDNRLKERPVLERAALELLAYAWATWGGYEEGDGIPEMMAQFLPDDGSWAALSDTELEPVILRKILETPGARLAMAPISRDGWARIPTVAIMQGAADKLWKPWACDPRYWPECEVRWGGKTAGRYRWTFHEPHTTPTPTQVQAAHELASSLNDWVPSLLFTLAGLYESNKQHRGRLEVETNDILREWEHPIRGEFQERVNSTMYLASQLVVQDLTYLHTPPGKRSKIARESLTEHLLTYNYRSAKGKGKNMLFHVLLLEPLLQMAADFSRQYAYLPRGSYAPDGRNPHSARLNRQLPLKARAQPAKFTQHGITIRELIAWAGVDADKDIDPKDRPWWKRNLPKKLGALPVLEAWEWKNPPPPNKWDQWLDARVLIQVKRPRNGANDIDLEEEEDLEVVDVVAATPQPQQIAAGWLADV